jgi:hypothetical protein
MKSISRHFLPADNANARMRVDEARKRVEDFEARVEDARM